MKNIKYCVYQCEVMDICSLLDYDKCYKNPENKEKNNSKSE